MDILFLAAAITVNCCGIIAVIGIYAQRIVDAIKDSPHD